MDEAVQVIARLTAAERTLVTAESCTGGLLGKLLTDVPGASAVYLGGIISYAYAVKERLLGVPHSLLEAQGAVCEPVARRMAEGARSPMRTAARSLRRAIPRQSRRWPRWTPPAPRSTWRA